MVTVMVTVTLKVRVMVTVMVTAMEAKGLNRNDKAVTAAAVVLFMEWQQKDLTEMTRPLPLLPCDKAW